MAPGSLISRPLRAWHGFSPSPVLLVLLFWLAAAWPTMVWCTRRMTDGSDEPLGWLALATALAAVGRDRHLVTLRPAGLAVGAWILLAAAWPGCPALLRAAAAVLALAIALGLATRASGTVALLMLSLPWTASLDSFFGAPSREFLALGSAACLQWSGIPVTASGSVLVSGDRMVAVDPPCTGLGMLWHALFLAAALAAWFRLGPGQTLRLSLLAAVLAVAANILRQALLFLPESGLLPAPAWAHEAVGPGCFLLALWPLVYLAHRWAQVRDGAMPADPSPPGHAHFSWAAGCSLLVAMNLANPGVRPLPVPPGEPSILDAWPETWQNQPLVPLEPDALESRFAAGFPGKIRRFALPDGQLILRRVPTATRMLHPSADCLRACGFRLVHRPREIPDANGRPQLAYQATAPDGSVWEVTESVRALRPPAWQTASVSAWFWHALSHPQSGPWEAATQLRPIARTPSAPRPIHPNPNFPFAMNPE